MSGVFVVICGMFSYYGSKSLLVNHYPPPKEDKIIEPFAGSARYALKYYDRDVLLVDTYDVVIKIWKWLQQCSKQDIMNLPRLEKGMDIRKLKVTEEEKMFLGMCAGIASHIPRHTVSPYAAIQHGRKNQFKKVADNLHKIRHWKIMLGNYEDMDNERATWFIDPPYQTGGSGYIHNEISYSTLAKWCESRKGQAIVCENTKADWMEFKPMVNFRGAMSTTTEAIWSNFPTAFDNEQIALELWKE